MAEKLVPKIKISGYPCEEAVSSKNDYSILGRLSAILNSLHFFQTVENLPTPGVKQTYVLTMVIQVA